MLRRCCFQERRNRLPLAWRVLASRNRPQHGAESRGKVDAPDLPTADRRLCAPKDRFGLAHRLFAVFE